MPVALEPLEICDPTVSQKLIDGIRDYVRPDVLRIIETALKAIILDAYNHGIRNTIDTVVG